MKHITLVVLLVVAAAIGCQSAQQPCNGPYCPAPTAQPNWRSPNLGSDPPAYRRPFQNNNDGDGAFFG